MDTQAALQTISDMLQNRGNLTPEQEQDAGEAIMALLGGFLTDQHRIADSLEQLAKCTFRTGNDGSRRFGIHD